MPPKLEEAHLPRVLALEGGCVGRDRLQVADNYIERAGAA